MHPFSKLRCDKCPATFDPELCYMRSHDCKTCYANIHECYLCRSPACFSTLNNAEREDFLRFVREASSYDESTLMEHISNVLTSKWWFEFNHSTVEACLNVLPYDETRVRSYLEHIYYQIYEKVDEEDEHDRRDRLGLY